MKLNIRTVDHHELRGNPFKKWKRLSIFIFLFSGLAYPGFSQPVLSLKEALEIGLENNFDIRIAKKEAEFARESNTYGNAGFLPTVGLTGSRTFQWNDIRQKFASGLEVDRSGVATNQSNLGLGLNWVVFDGGKMFITRKKLGEQQAAAELKIQNQILNFSDSLSAAYYQMVVAGLELDLLKKDAGRAEERLKMASEQFRLGLRPKSDMLLARLDLNNLQTRIRNQVQQIAIRKGGFNQMLGRDPELDFQVVDSVGTVQPYAYESLKSRVLEANLQLKLQKKNLDITRLGIREIETRALPQIGLTSGYNFGRTRNQAGFALYNQSLGPNVGLTASIPLFSGVPVRRYVKLANLELETRNLQLKLAESRILSQIWRSLMQLEFYQQSIEAEKANLELASENNDIVKGRFQLGQATSLELKDAEFQLSGAENRLLQAKYQARITENQILRLTGELKL